jgi:hypothetical protein
LRRSRLFAFDTVFNSGSSTYLMKASVAMHRSGRNRCGHVDPVRKLARERYGHIGFSARQRLPAFPRVLTDC